MDFDYEEDEPLQDDTQMDYDHASLPSDQVDPDQYTPTSEGGPDNLDMDNSVGPDDEGNEPVKDDDEEDADSLCQDHDRPRDDDDEDEEDEEEDDEDESMDERTDAELAAVALELQDLEQSVPLLKTSYHLLDRLGEGTFSSVYKAIDLHHHLYDNSQWATCELPAEAPFFVSSDAKYHPSTSTSSCSNSVVGDYSSHSKSIHASNLKVLFTPHSSLLHNPHNPFDASVGEQARNKFTETLQRHALECGKLPIAYKANGKGKKKSAGNTYVALKRIYVTSSPQRIMNELELLAQLRDARHVSYLIQAIRHEDQVIAIMPYRKHQDFREYYRTVSLPTIRRYLYCLFSALKDTHAKGIIHRDIKPANFLFDIHTKTGVLCDFGLAEQFHPNDWYGKCLHSLPEPKCHNFHGKPLTAPRPTFSQMMDQWKKWRARLARYRANLAQRLNRPLRDVSELTESAGWKQLCEKRPFDHEPMEAELINQPSIEWYESWKPNTRIGGLWGGGMGRRKTSQSGTPTDSNFSLYPEKVGFKRDDTRPGAKANRAGTRGFRAPEVLFKCPDQTGAIDIWSVGITLLCFLTRRFPFFNSNDDTDALLEIAAVFGRSKLEKSATMHNRTIISNIPEVTNPRFNSLHTLVRTLNPSLYEEQKLKFDPTGPCNVDKATSVIFQSHRDLSHLVEACGRELNPYDEPWYLRSELWYLVDLLKRTLDLDCTQRITAAQALQHKFFTQFE
ncbi:hypothetical protein O181_022085 [Austropuccinia psidii MF-1]|uniref:non-specific serine/threonine protein kinase n=1 Tax=Austropuccinia psidii MF-1 TaxID=1389203 RepID=A0A9Q3CGS3_9BASI|nr:hypothetical protein [Austropuccinia psidii MF-1]